MIIVGFLVAMYLFSMTIKFSLDSHYGGFKGNFFQYLLSEWKRAIITLVNTMATPLRLGRDHKRQCAFWAIIFRKWEK